MARRRFQDGDVVRLDGSPSWQTFEVRGREVLFGRAYLVMVRPNQLVMKRPRELVLVKPVEERAAKELMA